ncbi:MAG: glycosyltransferase family 4 protein [Alphaproteobacteria bacterium]
MTKPNKAKPAVLQVIPMLDAGGSERTTIEIAEALAREGFRALVASEGGRMEKELEAVGGELIRVPIETKRPGKILANAKRLADIVRDYDVSLLHARSRAPAWSALIAARRRRVPFVTTFHGIYGTKGALKRFYNTVMLRGDAVIANSEWTARHIRETYGIRPKRLVIIPRGVDLDRFDPGGVTPDRIVRLRAAWAGEGQRVVLLPGRLTRWKGQTVFLEALGQLKRKGRLERVRGVLAGDAQGRETYVAELITMMADKSLTGDVVIPGHVNDMPAAYLAADIVVSASTDPEAFGRAAAEAAAMGRPVIATDHGGARETVIAGETGLLVPPGSANALADALDDLLSRSEDELEEMGRKGRAHVATRYTVERMCADTIALYRELIDN